MSEKGIPQKGQPSGAAASAGSESKKPNCSLIDPEGATINSGYCSGRNDHNKKLQHSKEENRKKNEKTSGSALERCKGTDRSYNAKSEIIKLARKTNNLGVSSGNSSERRGNAGSSQKASVSQIPTGGSVPNKPQHQGNRGGSQKPSGSQTPVSTSVSNKPQHLGSDVSGTRGSFNAGSNVSGTRVPSNAGSPAPKKGPKQDSLKDIPGSESSFNNKKIRDGVTIKAAYDASVPAVKGLAVIGTRQSFNVKGQDSKIEGRGANINSGTYSGTTEAINAKELIMDVKNVKEPIKVGPLEKCSGTDQSFNALSYGEVNVSRGKLNTGAYSGNTTQERAAASHS